MAKPKILKLLVANGALLQAPVHESHHRGSNWLALIDVDASCPGGLSRRFLNKGRGECLYDIEQLNCFDPIEFGADYTTSMGKKNRLRWYGIVAAKTEGFLLVEESPSGARAVIRAKEARQNVVDRTAALRAQRDALIAKAEELDREVAALEATEIEAASSPERAPIGVG
jgi:hypothetical protein